MDNHVNVARRKLSFDITGQEPLRIPLSLQDSIHVAERESTHKQVSLFP